MANISTTEELKKSGKDHSKTHSRLKICPWVFRAVTLTAIIAALILYFLADPTEKTTTGNGGKGGSALSRITRLLSP